MVVEAAETYAPSPNEHIKIFAHRGASEEVPEHTLAAYKQAILDGADGLECDVRLTADGELVCVHDRRIDRTSNGRGLVSTLELAELRSLDFGRWKDTWGDFEDPEEPDRDRTEILTLEKLLELVADGGRPIELLVETKHPTRYAGLVERRLVQTLDRFGFAHPRLGSRSPVRVMSFSSWSLRRIRNLAPSLTTVLLMHRVPMRLRDGSLPLGVTIAGPSIEIVRAHPHYVDRVHARGHAAYVWTVNRVLDLHLCARIGVDGIITDRPRRTLEQLGR
jgi:glycerophosphoryl diester phosphodiesterase